MGVCGCLMCVVSSRSKQLLSAREDVIYYIISIVGLKMYPVNDEFYNLESMRGL